MKPTVNVMEETIAMKKAGNPSASVAACGNIQQYPIERQSRLPARTMQRHRRSFRR